MQIPNDSSAQMRSASYRLPVEDTAFLLRDEMRAVRFAMEYSKADLLLRDWGIRSTIIVFGSARVPSPEQAESMMEAARSAGDHDLLARLSRHLAWYEAARAFGRIASQRGGALAPQHRWRDNVIATGGGAGVMEAANRGASEAEAPSIGFNITLPIEQTPNPYTTPELTFRFHYFAMRKMHLAMRANALAIFPESHSASPGESATRSWKPPDASECGAEQACRRSGRATMLQRMSRMHSFWLWASVAIMVLVFALIARSAAAQTERGTEIIERALAAKPDQRAGARIFVERCASCHGRTATGSADPVTPSLAGQQALYLIKQMVDFAEEDRSAPDMHRIVALKDLSTPQALRDVSSYLHGLPGNTQPETGDGKDLAAGKRYYDGLCAFCHGTRGEGNEQHATPLLQGQHYSYLLMQSRRIAAGHRYSVPLEVIEVLERVPFDQLMAIADYASRLPVQAKVTPAAADASHP